MRANATYSEEAVRAVRENLTRFTPPPRVLVAEDDYEMARMIASVLTRRGCEVVQIPDGAQLVEYLVGCIRYGSFFRWPDLIITDIRMPGMTGIDVLSGLRAADRSTPMIVITAFGNEDIHGLAHRMGAAAVLDKPFDLEQLRSAVQKLAPLHDAGVGMRRADTDGGAA